MARPVATLPARSAMERAGDGSRSEDDVPSERDHSWSFCESAPLTQTTELPSSATMVTLTNPLSTTMVRADGGLSAHTAGTCERLADGAAAPKRLKIVAGGKHAFQHVRRQRIEPKRRHAKYRPGVWMDRARASEGAAAPRGAWTRADGRRRARRCEL